MPAIKDLITQKWPDIQIDKPLGSGACGTVFACTKKSATTGIESKEAVKVVRVVFSEAAHRQAEEEGISFDEYYDRVKAERSREIELLVNLKSPHIVHINEFDAVEEPDRSAFYLLIRMDLLQALDTFRAQHLADAPEQASAYAKKVALDICDALRVCHENGICHRDIKPANILYGATGDFYLGDFGVSQYTASPDATLTSVGTSRYAPPEQLIGQADPRSDLYSLGLVLYELTNHWRAPFLPAYPAKVNAEDRYQAQCRRLAGEPLPPPDNATPELASVLLKMCAPNPDDRYQSVQEVLAALSPAPAASSKPAAPKRHQKKHRALWAAGLAAAAVVLGLLVALPGMFQHIESSSTVFAQRDITAWDYARQHDLTLGSETHIHLEDGAYSYPCRPDGFHESFEPAGVTDWGVSALDATVTAAKKSDQDAEGNVTYTISYTARTQMDYTVGEDAEAFLPGIELRVLELMDLRSGFVFPLVNQNGVRDSTPPQRGGAPEDYTFTYQGKTFPVQISRSEAWDYPLPDYTIPGSYQTPVIVRYTYTVTVPQELDSLALYTNITPYTGYSHTLNTRAKTLDQQDSFSGFENYCFLSLEDLVEDFAAAPGSLAPAAGSYLEKMGAKLCTDTTFTVPNGCAGYLTNPYKDYEPFQQEDLGEDVTLAFGPGNAEVTITGVTHSDPDENGSVTYTVTFDTSSALQYGVPKAKMEDGTFTELGLGRCFAGFGLMDEQTGTVFAPQQGSESWPWSVPYLAYNSYTIIIRSGSDTDKAYSDAPAPTREDPCELVRPTTTYTLDDGRSFRLGFSEVGSWDFGKTTYGQTTQTLADGTSQKWVLAISESTMHGVLQIKTDADYQDLVLYYNGQPFGDSDAFSYSLWEGDGVPGPLYLDQLAYFNGMHDLRFYRLRDLADQFAQS